MRNLIYRFKRRIFKILWSKEKYFSWEENEGFHKNVVEKHYPKIPESFLNNKPSIIISVFNGFERHGGLADRFRGIVSAYKYAKEHHFQFAIYWEEPFILQDYLIPNNYNWVIPKEQLLYCRPSSCPIHIGSFYKRIGVEKHREELFQMNMLDKLIKKNTSVAQFHLYSNAHFGDTAYFTLFHELFKPSSHLQELIDINLQHFNGEFIAASFRFVHLLGDFKDVCGGENLSDLERKKYISDCIKIVEKLHSDHPSSKILVTSDSKIFLDEVRFLSYTYIVPGEISHTDGKSMDNTPTFDKEFLDLLLLSKAKVIYRIHKGKMYYSGFPLTAGMIGNVEVKTIEIK